MYTQKEQVAHFTPEAKRRYRILWSGHGSGQHPTVTVKSSELHQKKDFVRKKPSSDMDIMLLLLLNINLKKPTRNGAFNF